MSSLKYRVRWRDGSSTEDVDYDESMRLIKERPMDWASVGYMDAGKDMSEQAAKVKEKAWGEKKRK